MKYFIMPYLRKSRYKIVFHVGTGDALQATPKEMLNAREDPKSFIQKHTPEYKIIISRLVLRVDKANSNDINEKYIELLKEAKTDCIFNDNIVESDIDQHELHINESGSLILTKNLITGIRNFFLKNGTRKKKNNLSLQLKWQRYFD